MTITLQNAIERDIGRVVIILKDGDEIARMTWDDFMASQTAKLMRTHWLTEVKAATERTRFEVATPMLNAYTPPRQSRSPSPS